MPKPNSDCRATERKHPWPMARLGDVCEVISSRGHQIKQSEILPSGKYPVVSQSENPIEGFSDKEICIADVPIVLFGDHTCNVKLINDPFVVGADGTKLLKPNRHCMQYLYYCLQLLVLKLQDGKYRRHFGDLCDSEIPLPPLSVQREIVARLERELAAVEKMKKGFEALAETAKAEFKAELKEVFEEISRRGAETRRLGEVCEKIGSGATPLGGKKTYIENGTSLIRSQNVIDFSFSFLGLAHISETQAAQLDSVSVFDGDVLVNITGDSVARVCIVDNRCLPARVNQHVAIIRLSHSANVLNRYLEACLVAMKDELLKESVKGSTRKALTKDYLINLEIPVPPLSAQREVVARLDSAKARAEKLEAKAREGVAVCETMRKAILKEAFE